MIFNLRFSNFDWRFAIWVPDNNILGSALRSEGQRGNKEFIGPFDCAQGDKFYMKLVIFFLQMVWNSR